MYFGLVSSQIRKLIISNRMKANQTHRRCSWTTDDTHTHTFTHSLRTLYSDSHHSQQSIHSFSIRMVCLTHTHTELRQHTVNRLLLLPIRPSPPLPDCHWALVGWDNIFTHKSHQPSHSRGPIPHNTQRNTHRKAKTG